MVKFILELYASNSANTLLLMLPVATCQACDREFFDRWRGLMVMNYALHTHILSGKGGKLRTLPKGNYTH